MTQRRSKRVTVRMYLSDILIAQSALNELLNNIPENSVENIQIKSALVRVSKEFYKAAEKNGVIDKNAKEIMPTVTTEISPTELVKKAQTK